MQKDQDLIFLEMNVRGVNSSPYLLTKGCLEHLVLLNAHMSAVQCALIRFVPPSWFSSGRGHRGSLYTSPAPSQQICPQEAT